MANEPKPVKNAAKNLGHAIINWGKTKKNKATNAITSQTKRAKNAIKGAPSALLKKTRNTYSRFKGTKKNTLTKEKQDKKTRNTYSRFKGTKKNTLTKEKQDKITKLKEHIDYCKDLEKSYKEKHIEVQRLTTYLKDLSSKTPNEPISKSDVIKIIDKIGEIPDFNTNTKKTELDRLKGIQNKWKGEVEGMKNNIDKKIAILKTEPEEKHKEIIKPFGIP
jgi:hypothetical protein